MYLYPILVCCIQVKKSPLTRGKPLFSPLKELKIKKKNRKAWSLQEDTALVQFVTLHKDMQPTNVEWPAMKPQHEYWTEAAQYIQQTTQTDHLREGNLASLIVFKAVVWMMIIWEV